MQSRAFGAYLKASNRILISVMVCALAVPHSQRRDGSGGCLPESIHQANPPVRPMQLAKSVRPMQLAQSVTTKLCQAMRLSVRL
jgi:hypothetical protein